MERKRKILFSWVGAGLVLAILAAANMVSHFAYTRLDFSAGRIYSISNGTKSILAKLKDNLIIKVYYSPHLPAPYGLNESYIKDLLGEYKSAGHGHIVLEFINPDGNDNLKREAQEAGITPVQINVVAQDKFEVKEVFMGLVFLYQGKTQAIPVVPQDLSNLEYDLTERIKKLTQTGMKTVAFVTGHGEKSPADQDLQQLFASVRDAMNVETVTLDKPIPARIDSLWIIGPKNPYKPDEMDRLKAWVDSGRSLGLLLDRRNVNIQAFQTSPNNIGLDSLLSQWGMDLREGFVVDTQAEKIQVESQMGAFLSVRILEYPFIPVVTQINSSHPATRGIDMVTFPFSHPLIFKAPEGSDLHYTSLAESSAESWYDSNYNISPNEPIANLQSAQKGPFSLAGIIEGNFGKTAPSNAMAVEGGTGTPAPGRVVVVGTSYQIDARLANKAPNVTFFMNLLEWSLQDEAMLSIRAKSVSYRPLRPFSNRAREILKYFMILFLPILLLLSGLFIYRWQAVCRRFLPLTYGTLDGAAPPVQADAVSQEQNA